ncbi:hypothetical protein [Streptomyces acidiscabies]|uniref:Uncharacterized protein n=1 Tax=Streptomyces acidiscabies TaxID=42234 RepID=A0ABU4LXQ5_9ACTN|nr:hypothetical protein [Streptomyces acidiscabies]MDX3020049.1 hypothetical protein [Streptomyces acidiscabies]
MPTEATSPRITVNDLITRLRNKPQNLQIWVEAPHYPDGLLPLDGQVYTVHDSEPAHGDPHQCVVLTLSR